jgi:hypothetical protein
VVIRFCRDCANFEERRDIDGTILCMKNHTPQVCCEDFKPRNGVLNKRRLYLMSCPECVHFEDIDGNPMCARGHRPGVACEEFSDKFRKLNAIRQINQIKITLLFNEQNM